VGSRHSEEVETGDVISRLASASVRSKKLAERAEALCAAVGDQAEAEWELHHGLTVRLPGLEGAAAGCGEGAGRGGSGTYREAGPSGGMRLEIAR
jgi:hypothetical protein